MTKVHSILMILPVVPYPLRAQGISIRYLPIIKSLANQCHIDIIIISKHSCNSQDIIPLRKYCRHIDCISHPDSNVISALHKLFTRIKFFMPWSLPRSWVIYGGDSVKAQVATLTEGKQYDSLICVSGYNYQYLRSVSANRKIVDFIDSPTLLARRNVIGSNRVYPIRKFEQWKTYNWEAKIIREVDKVIYISDYDARLISSSFAPMNNRNVIPNGFEVNDYSEDSISENHSPKIGFLGNMSYFPNIEAVLWLYEKIFPYIKQKIPDVKLYIIGRDPDESILALNTDENVHITGAVDSIWPYINALDILVFPLKRGAGLKNKILEAMYANKLVITTNIGNEGINAEHNKHIVICETKDEFIKQLLKYIEQPELASVIATRGRKYIQDRFSWKGILDEYCKIVIGKK